MNIIITGATGFVGKNLSKFLKEKGHHISPLSLRKAWELDQNAEAIIHLAGKAHDTKNTSAEKEYFEINTELTKKLFKEFLNTTAQDFIYFSSVKATADTVEGFLDENHKSNPQTPYGKSKLEAEEFLLSQKLPENKRLFIIRPCMIHGPGNKGNLNLLYKFVQKGIPYPLAAFENKRSFLSIDNLNFLILEMLSNKNVGSGIYNFADDEVLSTNELVKLIANTSGKKEKLWKISSKLISATAKMGDVMKLPLNSERLKKLTENYWVSNQKIKNALGIDQLPVSASEGLEKTIKSFK
ncbi:NAD-dependent epimerase/dehydratase family protein [Cloacibacterium normanense]|uniref:3-beta hydroxysteroid dehydrogenase/isomerase family protein n=1 Tax=Cloacibacterium normanense TaxID=237258 RepID=A0A1E5UE03_9FLAO|nr:NAD-dependent epimerase/dehydratase family protein [Cloacibacterium normanense]AZI69873.1 NAD-dependent epimerase/dehydratase family protein [Cloacibacterium normanense]OEL11112.1 3-beta hydroxysteroid dehydrogenase/isomerase family protein [Cloacibacterium normanense]SDO94891.1 Nucleoside-diphosphate-sugar epimerase [Cloacibacterium normanense]